MIHQIHPSPQTLLDSLKYCLFSSSLSARYDDYGLDFMGYLIENDCHLPLFAAMDVVQAFFRPLANHFLAPVRPRIHDAGFRKRYERYAEFILAISDNPVFKRIGDDYQALLRAAGPDKNIEAAFYRTSRFILFELSTNCPFFRWGETYPLPFIKKITNDQITQYKTAAGKTLLQDEEAQLLQSLGIAGNGGQDPKPQVVSGGREAEIDTVLAPTMEVFKTAKEQAAEQDVDGRLDQLPQLIDYKLIDLYARYYDDFEPSEQLRHKLARLDLLSRTAIKRSPNYDQYSDLSSEGSPNPTYLSMGFKRFFIKMIEGGRVFIGNDPPIKDQDRIAVRFYLIEDLKSLNEKVVRQICVKNKAYRRYSHANIHKLVSFLLCHDMTRYLSMITHMDIKIQFTKFRVGDQTGAVSTRPISIRALRRNHRLNSGFVIRNRDLHNDFLIESASTAAGFRAPDAKFLNDFFTATESSVRASSIHSQHYDLFFGCGGTFINGNGIRPDSSDDPVCIETETQAEHAPSMGLKQVEDGLSTAVIPLHNRAFAVETNHRYLFAAGAGDHFRSWVDADDLEGFLSGVRESFLDYITDELIRLKMGKHYG